jgi:hypothetical protein
MKDSFDSFTDKLVDSISKANGISKELLTEHYTNRKKTLSYHQTKYRLVLLKEYHDFFKPIANQMFIKFLKDLDIKGE